MEDPVRATRAAWAWKTRRFRSPHQAREAVANRLEACLLQRQSACLQHFVPGVAHESASPS